MHPFLIVRAISARWGVSKSVVYQLVATGHLPALRIGAARGTIRVKAEVVDAFERNGRRADTAELAEHFG